MVRTLPKKTYQWLQDATEQWQSDEIISATQRRRILAGYIADEKKGLLNSILMMIAIVLIGGGVIMLVAHNWQHLNYLQRAVMAILPVIITQFALLYTVNRFGGGNHLANESAALFHGLSLGAAIALISQTYHLYGQISAFFLWWSLLILPVTYLVRAHSLFMLTLVLIIASYLSTINLWLGMTSDEQLFYLSLIAFLLPYLYFNPHKVAVFSWVIGFTLLVFIIIYEKNVSDNVLLYYTLYAGLLYLVSHVLKPRQSFFYTPRWYLIFHLPCKWIGGMILFAMMIYFSSLYFDIQFQADLIGFYYHAIAMTLLAIYGLCWLLLLVSRKQLDLTLGAILVAGFPLVLVGTTTLLLDLMDFIEQDNIEQRGLIQQYVLIAYLIIMSLQLISDAIKEHRWVKMNIALALIIYLLLTVFLQNSFDLIYRGIAFIIVGVAMVMLNLFIIRKYKHDT